MGGLRFKESIQNRYKLALFILLDICNLIRKPILCKILPILPMPPSLCYLDPDHCRTKWASDLAAL